MKLSLKLLFTITLSLLSIFTLTSFSYAEDNALVINLDPLKDQFGKQAQLKPETQWLIFVSEKPASKLFAKSVEDLKIKLDEKPLVYVSDISKMPALITKMFALPKMKKMGYRMVLDRKGQTTKEWPKEAGAITVMSLSNNKVKEVKYLKDQPSTEAFLKSL